MKNLKRCLPVILALLAVALHGEDLSGNDIVERMEKVLFPGSFSMKITMTTVRPGRDERPMVMENHYKEHTGSFIEILEPARSKGIRFLQQENSLFMYNPKSSSRRAVRLSPRESFQGSVFSNNDVGDTTFSDDYATTVESEEIFDHPELGQVDSWKLMAVAKHENAPYGRIVMWVSRKDFSPLLNEYYAKSGLLFRRMKFSGFRELAGRVRPTVLVMESMEEKGTYSRIEIHSMVIRNDLPDGMFTQSNLTR